MLKHLTYSNRDIFLKPYTTENERDLLLYTSGKYEFDNIFKILGNSIDSNIPISEMSYYEKLNILLQLKNISVGEFFSLWCTCNGCNKKYEYDAYFIDTIDENKEGIPDFKDIKITEAFSDNFQDYVKEVDLDELDVSIYDEIIKHIKKYRNSFDFTCESTCPYCEEKGIINLNEKILVQNLSDDEIGNFYKIISGMVYFGHYSLKDIYKMFPFERSIYLGLLNKQRTKESQK